MSTKIPIPETDLPVDRESTGFQINFKRIAARALRYWYFIALSFIIFVTTAFLINRYSTRIYQVRASIIIKENEENIGAKFLYDNELLNPYRNFYNELYIMKSHLLMQDVIENLNFNISLYREGEIKTTEYYDPGFPVEFEVLEGSKSPFGHSLYFTVNSSTAYSLRYISNDKEEGKEFSNLTFNDSIRINGFKLRVKASGDVLKIKDNTFIVRFNDPVALAKSYASRLGATWAQLGAAVVNLEITGPVAQKEIDFLNKFIERYQLHDVERKNKVATMAIGFLDEQLLVIGDSLDLYEDQVESFKRRNIITKLDEETNRLYQEVQNLEEQKFQYRLIDNYFGYISDLLKNDQYSGIFTPSSVGITDDVVANLINQLIKLQSEVDTYKSNTGVELLKDNPRLQEKQQQIQFIKSNILKTIDNTRATQKINMKFVNDQIKLVESRLAKLPGTERELIAIQRNYALRENLYVILLQKRTEAGLSKASTTSDISVVNPPMAGTPISPRVRENYWIGGGIGLILPFLIFLLFEMVNTRIQSKDDIEKITSVPVIGGIGHNPEQESLVVYAKPRSAMAESFRALRSNLNYFTGNKEHQVFMVTSSVPGEGKSFTTLNLATVFALAGKRTLIVGGDLRKPKLFNELKLNNNAGLSQYLSGMVNLDEIIQASPMENLYMIPGGPMPPNPSELLLKPSMEVMMTRLREQFDFVIVDTPPLTFVTDAFVLSKYADHVLFIVRQDFTPNVALRSLEEYYSSGKLTSISILFNDLRKSGLGYGYDGYGYGYGYGYYGYGYGFGKKNKDNGYYSD